MLYSVNFMRTATYIESVFGTVETENEEEAKNKVFAGDYEEDDVYDIEQNSVGDVEKIFSVEVADSEYKED